LIPDNDWPILLIIKKPIKFLGINEDSIHGDFDVQVVIGFDVGLSKLENAQHRAGILIKPAGERLVQGD
jgi:hypothetical protein